MWYCSENPNGNRDSETVGGAGDQSPGGGTVLHQLQQGAELFWRQGQIFPHRGEGFAVLLFMRHRKHDQP